MNIGLITAKLYAPWVHSLKEKRMIVNSICSRLKNKFNVSVCETAQQDVHQTIVIGIVFLASSKSLSDSIYENIQSFIESNTEAEIVEINLEMR
ncbi:DUF503 domain-containing protein [Paludicola sp. MB14-C6]|uniref:DUF503 domain-containing protein n=1 Tax=Paludihabitans sp. MB14-C6 TaxID=3070656 RepID=UPI0027DBC6DE|nr:DUF503 domain-containing protein [Paludicola sp. MB14-C6]WMJ24026.1 DUF503 domain-containing protein [Paludicola sp. MB14-C6]